MRRFRLGPDDEHYIKANVAVLCKESAQVVKGRCAKGGVHNETDCKQAAAEPYVQPILDSKILKMKQIKQSLVLKIRLLLSCMCISTAALSTDGCY